ncbi:MAG: hypothetical protein ACOX5F_05880 [Anaerovoracaceae bacterium]|jgi:hypothetical protein
MKQIIVLVSMIVLGVAIAGFVGDFKTNAETISDTAKSQIESIFQNE